MATDNLHVGKTCVDILYTWNTTLLFSYCKEEIYYYDT